MTLSAADKGALGPPFNLGQNNCGNITRLQILRKAYQVSLDPAGMYGYGVHVIRS